MDGDNSLGQIRDILVGPQIQSLEDRIYRLTERMDRELVAIRSEMNDKSASLESVIREEMNGLRHQLEQTQAEQHKSTQNLAAETAELLTHLNQTSKSFEEQLGASQQDLRHSFNERLEGVKREFGSGRDDLRYEMIELVEQMQRDKVDRSSVSHLFHQIADSLSDSAIKEDEPSHS